MISSLKCDHSEWHRRKNYIFSWEGGLTFVLENTLQVCAWVESLGLGEHVGSLRNNNVDGAVLLQLTPQMLIEDLEVRICCLEPALLLLCTFVFSTSRQCCCSLSLCATAATPCGHFWEPFVLAPK